MGAPNTVETVVVKAVAKAILGNNACLYVNSYRRGAVRLRQAKEVLDASGITYEQGTRALRIPISGGTIRFAVQERETRGYSPDCLFLDNLR